MEQSIFRPYRASGAERSDRAAGDRLRHRKKVRQAIRENIADIIAEEAIIGKDRNRIVKVPIRGIREYRFVYGKSAPGVGQGKSDGSTQPGLVVGTLKNDTKDQPDKAGDQPGEDYYETDVTIDELVEIVFEDLELPDLERKRLREAPVETIRKPKGTVHKGIPVRLRKQRSAKERLKRLFSIKRSTDELALRIGNMRRQEKDLSDSGSYADADELRKTADELLAIWQRQQEQLSRYHDDLKHNPERLSEEERNAARFPFSEKDLRYSRRKVDTRYESNAVVVCMMDTSGSMDILKKYLARVFFFLLYQFVKSKYKNVELVFIAHHTEAREVTEEEFFHKGESGGTFISSAYTKALEVIADRYAPALWNIYAFHCSDGDNFASDTPTAIKRAQGLARIANLFGYAEIKPRGASQYESSMLKEFRKIEDNNFQTVLIERKEDVFPMFRALIKKDKTKY